MAKYTKELKSRLDIIKFYYQQHKFYTKNIGEKVKIETFSDSIKHVLNNKNEYNNVRNVALEFYDWNRVIKKTMEHYKKME